MTYKQEECLIQVVDMRDGTYRTAWKFYGLNDWQWSTFGNGIVRQWKNRKTALSNIQNAFPGATLV